MSKDETQELIQELIKLKGWNQADLAAELRTVESAVSRWLAGKAAPRWAAVVLMRQWLETAREEARRQPA